MLRWKLKKKKKKKSLEVICTFLKALFSIFENVLPQNANHSFWALNLPASFSSPVASGIAWCEAAAEFLAAALTGFRHKKGVISSLHALPKQHWPRWKRKWGKGKDGWRPFWSQSLKIINKVYFRVLIENFLLTNKFAKEKKKNKWLHHLKNTF